MLAKLPRLATCIASQQPWCSAAALDPSATRKEDASVAIALIHLGAGNARQKMIVAEAQARYRGGASAQMPAALDACCILGVIERKPGGPLELFCMTDGVASHQSDTFEKVYRPNPTATPFAWELSGDGLTGWTWVYHQEPGESCVVRESARAWMKAEAPP